MSLFHLLVFHINVSFEFNKTEHEKTLKCNKKPREPNISTFDPHGANTRPQ